MAGKFTLPELPFKLDALEPAISKEIMDIHYNKHHKTYVDKLNAALTAQAKAFEKPKPDFPELIKQQKLVQFNAGGHINHSLFWKNLAPFDSPETHIHKAAPTLAPAIKEQWGSIKAFTEAFEENLLAVQGSGWGWLVSDAPSGKLSIVSAKDQDPITDAVPLVGVDMWEHAYYLQYKNDKKAYAKAIWKVINWKEAEARYAGGKKDAPKV
ncbi:manganese and iron superoxide dismutase [Aspergillus campestris IBT 28561]|uniref:Superoxide dismutase n=1 Tax=Aspergillus campestris (strain IBT 28561) TaxID=1392248 RepID=A0A2I1DFG7_ASPC2|nr:manganese and iron superoxide dismutase [Aspergillus campestris IBT 28561]PKY08625.1 manganese and iron superoxide dismutase [Aspergillus campestris IBT 28561]